MYLQRIDEMLNHMNGLRVSGKNKEAENYALVLERRVEAHLEDELADRASKRNRRNVMTHVSLLHLRHFPTDEKGAVYLNYGLSVNPNTYQIFDDGDKV